jgi:hypothetical protein
MEKKDKDKVEQKSIEKSGKKTDDPPNDNPAVETK